MENVLKIIYDKSINNRIINISDIDKILELLIIEKQLSNYILDVDIQSIRGNKLGSYSNYSKKITIYYQTIELMLKNIESNILCVNSFEKIMYKNLSLLQIILHEIEHANQAKISYVENSLEAFLIRMSNTVNEVYIEKLYEFSPQERLAEIKSYKEIITLISYIQYKADNLSYILETGKLQRLLRGYHYNKGKITSPFITFFKQGDKEFILQSFNWYYHDSLEKVCDEYNLNERFKFGFPISVNEYSNNMKKLLLGLNTNFNNRTNLKK